MKRDHKLKKEYTFVGHLGELRTRIVISVVAWIVGAVLCYLVYDDLLTFLMEPFRGIASATETNETLFVHSLTEGFLTRLKISILAGLVASLPLHMYNVIGFVFPGLKRSEQRVFLVSLVVSFVLVVASVYYSYYQIVPLSVGFLTSNGFVPHDVGLLLGYGNSVFFVLQFLFVTLVVFQLPIVLEVSMILKIVKRKVLLRMSRFIIVAVFALSAVLTPPDFVSQIAIALPLIALYFITLIVAKLFRFGE